MERDLKVLKTATFLLHRLQTMQTDYRVLFFAGICDYVDNLESSDKDTMELLHSLFESWPEHSGHKNFPVPRYGLFSTAMIAYGYSQPLSRWDRNHVYGASRWRLVDHCITELEKIITN